MNITKQATEQETVTLSRKTVEALVRAAHWPVIWSEMVDEPDYRAILGTVNEGAEDDPKAGSAFDADLRARVEKMGSSGSRVGKS